MNVITTEEYALYVDGVAWTPTQTTEEYDEYIIASGGRFVFYDQQGNVMFSFYNLYTQDFQILGNVRMFARNAGGDVITNTSAYKTYVQINTYGANVVNFIAQLEGNYQTSPAASSLPSTTNGEVGELGVEAGRLFFTVSDLDRTKPMLVRLGNVLIAYAPAQS